jgi:predicted DNA-binding transcriptional regulator YafY
MAKKKQRTDADRRVRQSERLSRLLRVLRCIMGAGRWDAETLARELEVSPRTIQRIMQVLSMSGVPWYYCKENECYRIRPGFKFSALEKSSGPQTISADVLAAARRLQEDAEKLLRSIQTLRQVLEDSRN